MNFTREMWESFKAKIIAALATLEESHELTWSGNFWTVVVPCLGTVVFREHYQRYAIQVKDVGHIETVEGLTVFEFEEEARRLFNTVHWRPNGPAAQEKAREERECRERNNKQELARAVFLAQLR